MAKEKTKLNESNYDEVVVKANDEIARNRPELFEDWVSLWHLRPESSEVEKFLLENGVQCGLSESQNVGINNSSDGDFSDYFNTCTDTIMQGRPEMLNDWLDILNMYTNNQINLESLRNFMLDNNIQVPLNENLEELLNKRKDVATGQAIGTIPEGMCEQRRLNEDSEDSYFPEISDEILLEFEKNIKDGQVMKAFSSISKALVGKNITGVNFDDDTEAKIDAEYNRLANGDQTKLFSVMKLLYSSIKKAENLNESFTLQKIDNLTDEAEFLKKIKENIGVDAKKGFGSGIVDYYNPQTNKKVGQLDSNGKHTYVCLSESLSRINEAKVKDILDSLANDDLVDLASLVYNPESFGRSTIGRVIINKMNDAGILNGTLANIGDTILKFYPIVSKVFTEAVSGADVFLGESKKIKDLKAYTKLFESVDPSILKDAPIPTYSDMIVVNDDGKVLLLQRNPTCSFEPNKWGFAGGKVMSGETTEEGAIRECLEECGLIIDPESVEKIDEVVNDGDLENISTSHYFTGKPTNEVVLGDEHQDQAWVTLGDLSEYDLICDNQERFENLITRCADPRGGLNESIDYKARIEALKERQGMNENADNKSKEFAEGHKDFEENVKLTNNPYDKGTTEFDQWYEGWSCAQDDAHDEWLSKQTGLNEDNKPAEMFAKNLVMNHLDSLDSEDFSVSELEDKIQDMSGSQLTLAQIKKAFGSGTLGVKAFNSFKEKYAQDTLNEDAPTGEDIAETEAELNQEKDDKKQADFDDYEKKSNDTIAELEAKIAELETKKDDPNASDEEKESISDRIGRMKDRISKIIENVGKKKDELLNKLDKKVVKANAFLKESKNMKKLNESKTSLTADDVAKILSINSVTGKTFTADQIGNEVLTAMNKALQVANGLDPNFDPFGDDFEDDAIEDSNYDAILGFTESLDRLKTIDPKLALFESFKKVSKKKLNENAEGDKIKMVVYKENTLGYIFPERANSMHVLAVGAGSDEKGGSSAHVRPEDYRLATQADFDNYGIAPNQYNGDEYEWNK
jgi:8-oxo-dGTP pyrophosphatase MutT (NUDIX family)